MTPEPVWTIPEPLDIHEVRLDDDAVIFLRRHGNPAGPRLILCHGNGLAADLYYPFWSMLTADFDLIVHDLRSHGWNPVTPLDNHNVPRLVRDHDLVLDAIDGRFGPKPQAGVFHSVSSMAPLLSPSEGSRFAALVLFDPPLRKPGATHNEFDEAAEKTAKMARRRTPRFNTREDFAKLLAILPTFRRAVPGVADLAARTTLRESPDGDGFELRCPREHEAQIIDHARLFAVLVDFDALRCPTKVIGADPTLPYSYLPTLDLSEMLSVDYDFLPETTHFLQLEQPAACVAAMREFLEAAGIA